MYGLCIGLTLKVTTRDTHTKPVHSKGGEANSNSAHRTHTLSLSLSLSHTLTL